MVVVFNDSVEAAVRLGEAVCVPAPRLIGAGVEAAVRLGEAVCGWRDFTGGVGLGA